MNSQKNLKIIAGVDEAGRGPLAGPVVAGAVILPENWEDFDVIKSKEVILFDSKKLTKNQLDKSFLWILTNCNYGIGISTNDEIDNLGIKKATNLAMARAVRKLRKNPEKLLVDGRDKFVFDMESEDIVKGDEKEACIAASSIIAKVSRDEIMKKMGKKFPGYFFENNKGYGTKSHLEALEKFGICEIHRKSYEPIRTMLTQMRLF